MVGLDVVERLEDEKDLIQWKKRILPVMQRSKLTFEVSSIVSEVSFLETLKTSNSPAVPVSSAP